VILQYFRKQKNSYKLNMININVYFYKKYKYFQNITNVENNENIYKLKMKLAHQQPIL